MKLRMKLSTSGSSKLQKLLSREKDHLQVSSYKNTSSTEINTTHGSASKFIKKIIIDCK